MLAGADGCRSGSAIPPTPTPSGTVMALCRDAVAVSLSPSTARGEAVPNAAGSLGVADGHVAAGSLDVAVGMGSTGGGVGSLWLPKYHYWYLQ